MDVEALLVVVSMLRGEGRACAEVDVGCWWATAAMKALQMAQFGRHAAARAQAGGEGEAARECCCWSGKAGWWRVRCSAGGK